MKFKEIKIKKENLDNYYEMVIDILYTMQGIKLTGIQREILIAGIKVLKEHNDNKNLFLGIYRKKVAEIAKGRNGKSLKEPSLAAALKLMREQDILPDEGLHIPLQLLAKDQDSQFFIPISIILKEGESNDVL